MPWWIWAAVIIMAACFLGVIWLCMPEKRPGNKEGDKK